MKIQTTLIWTWYPGAGIQKLDTGGQVDMNINHCGRWGISLNGIAAYVELTSQKEGHNYSVKIGDSTHTGFGSLIEAQDALIRNLPGVTVVEE